MKKYRIGEFSKYMGVSLKTLKHYEKFGLIVPEVDDKSNYRYYTYYHGGKMLRSRRFTQLGFTVKETASIMNGSDNDSIICELKRQEETCKRELEIALLRQERLREIKDRWILFKDNPNTWLIAKRKACYFLKHVNDEHFLEDTNWCNVETLMTYQPHVLELSCHYPHKENLEQFRNDLGLGIYVETAGKIGIDVSNSMRLFEEESCFLYIYSKPYIKNGIELIIKEARKVMKDEGFLETGDILVEHGFDQNVCGNRIYQCLVWIPARKDDMP